VRAVYCQVAVLALNCVQRYIPDESGDFVFALMTKMMIVGTCLSYMNACVNPIVYAVVAPPFRGHVRRLFVCCPPAVPPGHDDAVTQHQQPAPAAQQQPMEMKYRP